MGNSLNIRNCALCPTKSNRYPIFIESVKPVNIFPFSTFPALPAQAHFPILPCVPLEISTSVVKLEKEFHLVPVQTPWIVLFPHSLSLFYSCFSLSPAWLPGEGWVRDMMPTAAMDSTAPKAGGPQGLNSWTRPEKRGADARPMAVTDCARPTRVPPDLDPPASSCRWVRQVLPKVVDTASRAAAASTRVML